MPPLAPLTAADVVFEPAAGDQERVAKGHENVFVGMVAVVIAIDDDLASGNHEIDPHGIEPALPMVPMRLRDHDVAAGDAVGKPLQLVDVVEGRVADHLIDRKIVERHLGLRLHGHLSSVLFPPWGLSRRARASEAA